MRGMTRWIGESSGRTGSGTIAVTALSEIAGSSNLEIAASGLAGAALPTVSWQVPGPPMLQREAPPGAVEQQQVHPFMKCIGQAGFAATAATSGSGDVAQAHRTWAKPV